MTMLFTDNCGWLVVMDLVEQLCELARAEIKAVE